MKSDPTNHWPEEGCVLRIRSIFPSLRPSEQKVAQFVLGNPERAVHLSVTEMAKHSRVSDATVVKFSQHIGYSGYQELKINLAQELPSNDRPIYGAIQPEDDLSSIKEKLFAANQKALADTCRIIDLKQLSLAVSALCAAKQIHVYGVGASGVVALDAEHKFSRIGIPCHGYVDPHQAATMAALLGPESAAIGISHSGATRDTAEALRVAKLSGATTICITNYMHSPIARDSDVRLITSVEETDFRSGAMASRVAQLSLIDVLFIAVAQEQYEQTMSCLEKTRRAVAGKRF